MSPSPRLALLLAAVALATILVGPVPGALAALALVVAAVVDAAAVRREPRTRRELPTHVARSRPSPFWVQTDPGPAGATRLRQPFPPDLVATPAEGDATLEGELTARRRGRHTVPPPAIRREGPLRLGRWDHQPGGPAEILAYPDLPQARRIALAVKSAHPPRIRDPGLRLRGPLGLGTDFESIRDYVPDDDIRQVNWAATQRTGRPMSNTYRVEQERDVWLLLDAGRLMAAPLGDATRLDVAVDAAVAVAAVADVLGDRCGVLAFDGAVRRQLPPRRAGGAAVSRAIFDLEPSGEDADYERAFQSVAGGKRALIVVFTDLVEEAAARPLAHAVPVLARRHALIVATAEDEELTARTGAPDPNVVAVATQVTEAVGRAAALLERGGAVAVQAPPASMPSACVAAYLRVKSRARL